MCFSNDHRPPRKDLAHPPGFCLIKKLVPFREPDLGGWLYVHSVDPDIVCFSASAGPQLELLYSSLPLLSIGPLES